VSCKQLMDNEIDRRGGEHGQTSSEYAVVLTVISGTSVFLSSSLSQSVATALNSMVRLLP
jgi:Flp pilus assembly pilin Flp